MNKNKTTKKTDAYVKLMLYSIAEKFVTLNDVLLPKQAVFIKALSLNEPCFPKACLQTS